MTRSTLVVFTLLTFLLTACGADLVRVPPSETPIPPPTTTFTVIPAIKPTAASASTVTAQPVPTESPVTVSVSFANDVMPILQSRCFNCHGGRDTEEGLSFASYETLIAGSKNGPVVIPGDPGNSLFIQQLLNGKMPKRGPKLTPNQLQILIDWILAGALNN